MGHTGVQPGSRQLQNYELEYWLLRTIRSENAELSTDRVQRQPSS